MADGSLRVGRGEELSFMFFFFVIEQKYFILYTIRKSIDKTFLILLIFKKKVFCKNL